jgi:hypothetical protein
VSDQVVDALARALKLDDLEWDHLRSLTRPPSPNHDAPARARQASSDVRSMIEALDPTPALVHNAMLDVLAINRMGSILFDGLTTMPLRERNLARWAFLDPRATAALPQWEVVAASPGSFRKLFHHDLVGDLDLLYQSLIIPQDPDQYVAVYTPRAGSPTAERMAILSTWNPQRDLPDLPSAVPRDEQPVQDLAPNGAYPPLRIGVGPRRPHRRARSSSSSASFAAELRASSTSHPITWQNSRYSSRRVIRRSSRPDDSSDELAGQGLRLSFWHPHARLLVFTSPDADVHEIRFTPAGRPGTHRTSLR